MNGISKKLEDQIIAHNSIQKDIRQELVMIELRIRRLEDHLTDMDYSDGDYELLLTLREIAESVRVQIGSVRDLINWDDRIPF